MIYVDYLLSCAPEYQKGKDFVVVFCYASRGGVQWKDGIIGSILLINPHPSGRIES